jgi:FtsH-binding integral membrane protein
MNNFEWWAAWLYMILFVIAWLFAIVCWFWSIIDVSILVRPNGKIKRGIRIRTRPLSLVAKQYLLSISKDMVERRKTFFGERVSGFICAKDKEIIICSPNGGFPFLGYVNLNSVEPTLEIRSSLPLFLFFVPFFLTIVLIPFALLVIGLGYHKGAISFDKFFNGKIEEYTNRKIQIETETNL